MPDTPIPTREYWRRANRHAHEPLFEADGACVCGAAANHRVHRGAQRSLADTPLGRQIGARSEPRSDDLAAAGAHTPAGPTIPVPVPAPTRTAGPDS